MGHSRAMKPTTSQNRAGLYRIVRKHYVAGIVSDGTRITEAAPILGYAIGWSHEKAASYFSFGLPLYPVDSIEYDSPAGMQHNTNKGIPLMAEKDKEALLTIFAPTGLIAGLTALATILNTPAGKALIASAGKGSKEAPAGAKGKGGRKPAAAKDEFDDTGDDAGEGDDFGDGEGDDGDDGDGDDAGDGDEFGDDGDDASAKKVTEKDVYNALAALTKARSKEVAMQCLTKVGKVGSLSKLEPANYQKVIDAANKAAKAKK